MTDAIEIPESNLWVDFVWPEWVPADVRAQVEKRFKPWRANDTGPKQWWERSEYYQHSRPNFGELLTAEGVRGRYVSMGSVGGVLVLADGTHKHINNPGKHGCEGPPVPVTTEKSAALTHFETSTVTVYRLRRVSADGLNRDWCDITIDEGHGTLHVNGDHGSWSYRWGGKDITDQIAYWFNPDYIAGKLAMGKTWSYDGTSTEREVRLVVLKARRAGEVTREQARQAWDALNDEVNFDSAETMMSDMGNLYLPDVPDDLFVDVYELIRESPRGDYLHLRDAYIPALIDLLRSRPSPSPDPLPGTAREVSHG